MGRHIPAKKHKGVNDPRQQQLKRESLVKDKINAPPVDIDDDQPMPSGLLNMLEQRRLVDQPQPKIKKMKWKKLVDSRLFEEKEVIMRGMNRKDDPVPAFVQHPGETSQSFLRRVDRVCREVENSARASGKAKKMKSVEDEVIDTKKQLKKIADLKKEGRTDGVKLKGNGGVPELTKKQERLNRLKEEKKGSVGSKRDKMLEKREEALRFQDPVAFGEVVHGPPNLNIPSRNKARKAVEPKPGKRSLLLAQMFAQKDNQTEKVSKKSKKKPKVDRLVQTGDVTLADLKSTKMKYLPVLEQQRIEQNRIKAVEAYRKLKGKPTILYP